MCPLPRYALGSFFFLLFCFSEALNISHCSSTTAHTRRRIPVVHSHNFSPRATISSLPPPLGRRTSTKQQYRQSPVL
ncbi:hypothetical protein BZA05DRAFT_384407 [Tricharina praecox]|uniref:uncharacterized protein n=1 Tax=Tricharina praecox TaxID=43433 RepID=UPI002220201D|nr:uncharacterized protein BZA05DRAFT_384407 [Tricharina praecox]KAI5857687.1 hypothetical protein BZA05DRAFT_384407 [Tricharina praecox]